MAFQVYATMDQRLPLAQVAAYARRVEAMGYDAFAQAAADAGVDGVLIVDMPPEEGDSLTVALHRHGLDAIFLIAPTSSASRIQKVCRSASGFVYYVSFKGVTGANRLDVNAVAGKLEEIRKHIASFPKAPGVYLMKDGEGRVLYVGKAKDLRSRVSSYFQPSSDLLNTRGPDICRMIAKVVDIDFLECDSEVDAMLKDKEAEIMEF